MTPSPDLGAATDYAARIAAIAAIAACLRIEAAARAVDPVDLAAAVITHYDHIASLGIDRVRMPEDRRPLV
ncbi:MAG: hypothetical protein JNM13_16305 [Hyphomicrobiaceae bacterium]|nr:hypothetical protein [Hyphomicrobiaceae bacterium]